MKVIGLVHQPKIAASDPLAGRVQGWLESRTVDAWRAAVDDKDRIRRQASSSDLLLTFGGDGTIVAAAHLTAGTNVPILGINLGRVGFLTEVEPDDVFLRLEAVLDGRFWLEERMMLHAELVRDGKLVRSFEALNDVVTSRGRFARMLRIDAQIDGQHLTTYFSDGVIAATPTGSTAYSLAAGGPILHPQLRNLVITPIAAHLTVAQSLVLHADARVQLTVRTGHEAALTVDGQEDAELGDGDVVVVTASPKSCRFVRTGETNYFYRTLLEKLR